MAAVGVAPVPGKRNDFRLALRTGGTLRAADLLSDLKAGDDEVDVVERIRFVPMVLAAGVAEARRPQAAEAGAGDLYPGGSCGHYDITAGTLGGFVEDADRYYILSNNHVLADSDRGRRGDPILEPGPADIGDTSRVIGHLIRWAPLGGGTIDAALATIHDDLPYFHPWTYRGIGHMDPAVVADRYAVRNVTKLGRTTGVTSGTVSAYELDDIEIDYGSDARPYVVRFDNQIEMIGAPPARPFSLPGDSGSFILDADTLRPYALLFAGGAGSDRIDRTIASPMVDVLSQLNVRLIRS